MSLGAGDRLGPHEIVAPIGAGGMGEVYKARDTRLDRTVAIKVSPANKGGDAERKERFLQEAKAASALNHPNIVTIYDIGSNNGIDYIAMEYVAGKTLDQLIPHNGMRLSEMLRYATQAADALSKAHQAGIIHRDLKPSNVIVSPDGVVKVLDFGLAKLTAMPPKEDDATRTMKALTGDGALVGTTYYMSPEQAEAKPADARSDIFSFGVMLYEMATGQRPFSGNSQIAVLSSILREDPKALGGVRADLPAELNRVITRCLRKDPARRFQHMADLKVALEELKEEFDSGTLAAPVPAAPPAKSSRLWITAVVALVLIVLAFAVWRFAAVPPKPTVEAVYRPVPITSYTGTQDDPSFSPDASQIAFDWDGPQQDNFDIYVKLIGAGSPLRLTTDPAPDILPKWSPDGKQIAFLRMSPDYTHFSVIVIPALGGPERRVGTFANNPNEAGMPVESLGWTPDSKALVVSAAEPAGQPNRLILVSLEGGAQKILTHPDRDEIGDALPVISNDGHKLAFLRAGEGVSAAFVLALSASVEPQGEPHQLALSNPNVTGITWLRGDREIVYAASEGRFSSRLFRTLLDHPQTPSTPLNGINMGAYSPTVRGNRLAFASGNTDANFWAVDLNTKKAEMDRALSSSFRDVFPQFSSDGKRVVFYSDRGGSVQVWVANRDGSQATALTSMPGPTTGSPRWSPDGQQISFDSNTGGTYHVYVIPADGGQPRQVSPRNAYSSSWSHDGRWIYFGSGSAPDEQVWKVPASGGDAQQVTHGGGGGPQESPDGKTLFFVKNSALWQMPVEGGEEKQVIEDVYRTNYAVTDKGIYFTPRSARDGSSSVQFFDFAARKSVQVVKITKPVDLGLGISPDSHTLLYSQLDYTGSNLMLVENFR